MPLPQFILTVHFVCDEEEFCLTEGCQGGAKEEFISIALAPQLRRILEGTCGWQEVHVLLTITYGSLNPFN